MRAVAAFLPALALFAAIGTAHAEDVNLTSRPETTTVALSRYAIGPGIGALGGVSGDMSTISPQFLSLSLAQSIRFRENWDMGLDVDYWAPRNNWGGDMSVSYLFGDAAFRPFVGLGAGLRSLDYKNEPFGDGLGVEGLVQAGVYLDVLDNLQLRVRVPYRVIANTHADQAAGLDVSLLFSSGMRKTKVRKLTY
ncbi:MAG TPA: hypothetical protein VHO02_05940 [Fibrobacteria bacterium]|jgi:hypothetical protein|nr:hypothetical protein [Fibrobacteria bacterium]